MAMAELFPLCVDVLDSLSMAVLRTCPEVLEPHLHTIVTTLMPHARRISSNNGKQVRYHGIWQLNTKQSEQTQNLWVLTISL